MAPRPSPRTPGLLLALECRATPPRIRIVRRRGRVTTSLSRLRLCRPAHRPSAAWRLCQDLNLFLEKCRWAHAHLNISLLCSSVSQTPGCERTSWSRRWPMEASSGRVPFDHLALSDFL